MKEINSGKNNGMWKGDDVGLDSLHEWIKNHKQKPNFCEICNKAPPYDLANISGEYKRDITDFEWLCRKCHMKKDGRLKNFIVMAKIPKTPWNKGLTKETDKRIKTPRGAFKKGCVPWNKGKKCPQLNGANNGMYGVHRYGEDNFFHGKKHTKETKEKISKIRKAQPQLNSEFKKGHIPWNKGKVGVYSQKTLKKMSETRKENLHIIRKKNETSNVS